MPRTLLALLLTSAAAAASAPPARHARELRSARAPNILSVPELRPGVHGWRALAAHGAALGGAAPLPAVHHRLLAHTDVGFIDYSHTTIAKAATVSSEDYAQLLSRARFACEAAAEEQAEAQPDSATQQQQRSSLLLTLELTAADAASEDYAHLAPRLRASEAYLVLDLHLLAEHADFAPGSACAALIPVTATSCAWVCSQRAVWCAAALPLRSHPLYATPLHPPPADAITAHAEAAGPAPALTLTLRPVPATALHHYMDVTMHYTPDGEGEVARRAAAALPLGADLRRRRRSLLGNSVTWPWAGSVPTININSVGSAPSTATVTSVELTSVPGLLACQQCHAEYAATYSVTYQFCLGSTVTVPPAAGAPPPAAAAAAPSVLWYTSNDATGCLGAAPAGTAACPALTPITTANFLDCAGSGTWISNVGTAGAAGAVLPPAMAANTVNAALNIEAYITGSASVSLVLNSNGFSANGNTGGCAGSTDSSTCAQQQVVPFTTALLIQITTGMTAEVAASLTGAVVYTGQLAGNLAVGISGTAASLKLGGRLATADFNRQASGCTTAPPAAGSGATARAAANPVACAAQIAALTTPYTNIPLAFAAVPLGARLTGASAGVLDATLWTNVRITVDSVLPFLTSTSYQVNTALVPGKAAAGASSSGSGGGVDTAASCPATGSVLQVTKQPSITGLVIGPTLWGAFMSVVGVPQAVSAALQASTTAPSVPAILAHDASSALAPLPIPPKSLNGVQATLAGACLAVGVQLSGGVDGACAPLTAASAPCAALVLAGQARGGSGGGGGGGDAVQPLTVGAIVAIVLGSVAGAILLCIVLALAHKRFAGQHKQLLQRRGGAGEPAPGPTSVNPAFSPRPSPRPAPAALVPAGWERHGPDASGDFWYEHLATGHQQWDYPTEAPMLVTIPGPGTPRAAPALQQQQQQQQQAGASRRMAATSSSTLGETRRGSEQNTSHASAIGALGHGGAPSVANVLR